MIILTSIMNIVLRDGRRILAATLYAKISVDQLLATILLAALLAPIILPAHALAFSQPLETIGDNSSSSPAASMSDVNTGIAETDSSGSPLAALNKWLAIADSSDSSEKSKAATISDKEAAVAGKEASAKKVARIEVEIDASKTIATGEKIQLAALPLDKNENPVHGIVPEWHSSNPNIIKIVDDHEAIALSSGEAVLTVSAGTASGEIKVTVTAGNVEAKTLAAKNAFNKTGKSAVAETITAAMLLNQPPDDVRDSLFTPDNNLGSPPGQTEMDAPVEAAALRTKERAGIANFSFGIPLASLPGRGINAGAGIVYNSRVWNKSSEYDAGGNPVLHFTYDVEGSWLAPGFNLGFGYLDVFDYGNNGGIVPASLTDADGTRHQVQSRVDSFGSIKYETSDGTFIRVTGNHAIYSDGTKVTYQDIGGPAGRRFPVTITDRNGNMIQIAYPAGDGSGRIAYIRDTMNRYIRFHYDATADKKLVAVTVPSYGSAVNSATSDPALDRQTVRFYYDENVALQTENRFTPGSHITAPPSIRKLRYVYFPATKSGYRYDYSPYFGMITKMTSLRGMLVDLESGAGSLTQTGAVTSEGQTAASTQYHYPGVSAFNPLGGIPLTDVPQYNRRTDSWHDGTTTQSADTSYTITKDETAKTRTTTIIAPDGSQSETVVKDTPDGIAPDPTWEEGLVKETRIKDANGNVMSKTVMSWLPGTDSFGYRSNPVVKEINTTNEAGLTKKTKYDYDGYNNPTIIREFDYQRSGQAEVELRQTVTSYQTDLHWINNRLLHLPLEIKTIVNNETVSRVKYEYDNYGLPQSSEEGDVPGPLLTWRDDIDINTHSRAYNPAYPRRQICSDFAPLPADATPTYPTGAGTTVPPPGERCWWIGYYTSASDYRGNVTKITAFADPTKTAVQDDPKASVTELFYDIAGNEVAANVNCCQKKTWTYQKATEYTYPVIQTRGANSELSSSAAYDYNTGLTNSSTDESGTTTVYTYDAGSLRLTQTDYANGGKTNFDYYDTVVPAYVKTTTKLDVTHNVTRNVLSWAWMDGRGASYRTRTQTPDGYLSTDVEFDNMGRAKRSSNPYTVANLTDAAPSTVKWTEVTGFDALGRALTVKMQDDSTVKTEYSQIPVLFADSETSGRQIQGTAVTVTEQAGKQRRTVADALGRIVRTDEPDGSGSFGTDVNNPTQPTYFWYDGNDNLRKTSQTGDGATQERLFKYDGLSRLTHEKQVEATATLNDTGQKPASGGLWTGYYEYDSFGRLAKGVDARGVTTTFVYDALNRQKTITYTGETGYQTPKVTYYYGDEVTTNQPAFSKGRLIKVTTDAVSDAITGQNTPATSQSYGYNAVGQVTSQTETIGTDYSYSLSYGYNLAGALTSQTYPSGRVVTYSLDSAGRLGSVADAQRTYANNFQFAGTGALKSLSLGNGTTESYALNDRLQLESQSLVKDNMVVQKFVYGYGETNPVTNTIANNGKLSTVDKYVGGTVTAPVKQNRQKFTYDSIGRLKQVAESNGNSTTQAYQQTYSYDRFGNRFQKATENQNSVVPFVPVETTDIDKTKNQFTPATNTTYNEDGSVQTEGKFRNQSYWFDGNGRMIKAHRNDNGWEANSIYDALGQRVGEQSNGTWTYKVYDIAGQLVAEYGGASTNNRGEVNYVHQDWQGSTRAVTNSGGGLVSRHDYAAFGAEIPNNAGQNRTTLFGYAATDSIRQKYGLTERDDITGLDHTDWRKLDNQSGRWTSPDPYKGSMSLSNPQSLNRYSYVNNDPVNFVDPSGLNASSGSVVCFTFIRDIYYNGVYLYSREEGGFCFGGNNTSSGGGTTIITGGGGGGGQQTKRAKFDDGKFKDCVKKLFETTVNGYAWNGKVGAFSGQSELTKTYSDYWLNSSKNGHIGIITSTELNTVQLGERAGQRLGVGGGRIIKAWTDENNPRNNFVAKDFAGSGEFGRSLWVYELGNALGFITGKNKDITVADKRRYDDPPDKDVGGALVDCVYDGAVTPQGGIKPPSSGR